MDFKTIHLYAKVAEVMKRDPNVTAEFTTSKHELRRSSIINALDLDESGYVDEDEFISGQMKSHYHTISTLGCLRDEVFVDILENFDADKLWGKFGF